MNTGYSLPSQYTRDRITENLNPPQYEAVTAEPGNMLVLAGAGSGKTRVLVHRLAYLVAAYGVSPYELMAMTFTNKAAGEMRSRALRLLDMEDSRLWVGTFHGLAHRILRMHWRAAGLPENFEILGVSDQRRLIKRIFDELQLPKDSITDRDVLRYIDDHKNNGRHSTEVPPPRSGIQRTYLEVFLRYEKLCRERGAVDFNDLLLYALDLWRDHDDILAHYRNRFSQLLIDEFQDTNAVQYAWVKLLAGQNTPKQSADVTVVGDDDQAIYGWRGASIANIQEFQTEFKDTKVIRLERNYRSTANILNAANALIKNNSGRLGKTLWTEATQGDPIHVFPAYSETEEAKFVLEVIADWVDKEPMRDYNDVAILYRTNAQSRALEEEFVRAKLPYRIHGGTRFYERAEVRDAVAYMRLAFDPHADIAFERVLNTPRRGIGARTEQLLREAAAATERSLWALATDIRFVENLPSRARTALQTFTALIEKLRAGALATDLPGIAHACIHDTGLYALQERDRAAGKIRQENLQELIAATVRFEEKEGLVRQESDAEIRSTLRDFLDHARLNAGEQEETDRPNVSLMTLHSAKGLEFPLVFITGWEQGLFPSFQSVEDEIRAEEERRLAYVGITRCMETLFLTFARSRMRFGRTEYACQPSKFLHELPDENLHEIRPIVAPKTHDGRRLAGYVAAPTTTQPRPTDTNPDSRFQVGDMVDHTFFGTGVVVEKRGLGAQEQIQIAFEQKGTKWLIAAAKQLSHKERA